MSRTDRDDLRRFWNTHFDFGASNSHWSNRAPWEDCAVCASRPEAWRWARPYRHEDDVPTPWKRSQRREERGRAATLMRRARSGHLDWDDFPAGTAKIYRRPYYW